MKRTFSAVILLAVAIASCSKVADNGSRSESVLTPSAAPSASTAPIDQVPPAPTTPAASTTGVIGAPVTTPTATPDQGSEAKPPATPRPTTKPAEERANHARPKMLPPAIQEPSKKPSPVGTSQAGRVVRFTCPSGEVPSQVMGGCMCGSEIANPCGPGVRVPDLRVEGKTCLFTCP
jgi:hypothetical protein